MSEPILDDTALWFLRALVFLSISLALPTFFFRASATFRHALLATGLSGLLFLPVASVLVPQWKLTLLQIPHESSTPSSVKSIDIGDPLPIGEGAALREHSTAAVGASEFDGRQWILLLWATGVLALIARMLLGDLLLNSRLSKAQRLQDPTSTEACQLARQLGIRRDVRFYVDERVRIPLVWGVWRPAVLLPVSSKRWDKEKFRMILLHELAHVRRRDLFFQKLALVVRAIYWFLPPAWLAARLLRREGEKACDELVLSRGVQPRSYARELVRSAALMGSVQIPEGAIGLLRRTHLEDRVRAILKIGQASRSLTVKPHFAWAVTLTVFLMLPIAALVPEFTSVVQAGSEPIVESLQTDRPGSRDGSLSWTEGTVRQRLRMKGVRISEDYRQIDEILPGGYFRFSEKGGSRDQRLEVEPGPTGDLEIRYWVGGAEWTSGGEEYLREALLRLQELDSERGRLNDSMGLWREDLEDAMLELRESLSRLGTLRLDELRDSLQELRVLRQEPLRLHLEDLSSQLRELRPLQDLQLEDLGSALHGLSLDLNIDLQPQLEELKLAMGDLKIRMGDLREELQQRREDFADGLVQAQVEALQSLEKPLGSADWDSLELKLTIETDRLIRRSGLHVEDGEWGLDSNRDQEGRFKERLQNILEDLTGSIEEAEKLAETLLDTVRKFRMRFED